MGLLRKTIPNKGKSKYKAVKWVNECPYVKNNGQEVLVAREVGVGVVRDKFREDTGA